MQFTQLEMINEELVNQKIGKIAKILGNQKVIIAFSGGVDSSVVAFLAKKYSDQVILIMQDGLSVGLGEVDYAKNIAKLLNLPLQFIKYNEFELSENYAKNPSNRCYYCKQLLHGQLEKIRVEKDYDFVINGTNASDLEGHRPGYTAIEEFGAISPLVKSELSKFEIRWIAKKFDLPVWDKPATACLASRFQTGIRITEKGLKRVAVAENYIRTKFQIQVLRVRDHNNLARIEVGKDEMIKLNNPLIKPNIIKKLQELGYDSIIFDSEGYRAAIPNEDVKYG